MALCFTGDEQIIPSLTGLSGGHSLDVIDNPFVCREGLCPMPEVGVYRNRHSDISGQNLTHPQMCLLHLHTWTSGEIYSLGSKPLNRGSHFPVLTARILSHPSLLTGQPWDTGCSWALCVLRAELWAAASRPGSCHSPPARAPLPCRPEPCNQRGLM